MTTYEPDDLLNIEQGCLQAVLDGGETWQQFMFDAEQQLGMRWSEIVELLNLRAANRKKAA